MYYVEHDIVVEAPASFDQTDETPTEPKPPINGEARLKVCPYCADPDCENPLFCAAYEPPLLDTVPLNSVGDLPVRSFLERWGSALFSSHMLLYLEISGVTSSVVLHPSERIVLGRVREHQPCEHVVDLTPYDARQHGVSRVHAAITLRGRTLVLTDLGSTNGTYLNDQHLLPNQPRILRDGDHILLGNLTVRARFK